MTHTPPLTLKRLIILIVSVFLAIVSLSFVHYFGKNIKNEQVNTSNISRLGKPSVYINPLPARWENLANCLAKLEQERQEQARQEAEPVATPVAETVGNLPWSKQSPGVEWWRPLLERYEWDVNRMLRIIEHESHGNPSSYNPDGPYIGAFQFLNQDGEYDGFDWTNPEWQVQQAYEMWKSRGYQPWAGTDY